MIRVDLPSKFAVTKNGDVLPSLDDPRAAFVIDDTMMIQMPIGDKPARVVRDGVVLFEFEREP